MHANETSSPCAPRPAWLESQVPMLGRYRLGPLLGKGGMGEVHEAWDPLLCRLVALKTLKGQGPLSLARFLREAQLQARLEHPNICRIFDVECSDASPRIAMQRIQGVSLDRWAGALSTTQAASLLEKVAQAVHAAHQKQLIHRDLKPANILVEGCPEEGMVPYVCDFGLAMDLQSPALTRTQMGVGTPGFMAPEQLLGQRHRIGVATDIFGLGATLHHLLTGQSPAKDGELKLAETLPPELKMILGKCLEAEPEDRYESAAELAEDLRRYQKGELVSARPVESVTRVLRALRHHPDNERPDRTLPLILVVDDAPEQLMLLEEVLGVLACRIRTASRGSQALELLRQEKPDLVLLDIVMPEMDGLQVFRSLQLDPDLQDIPVIFLTGKAESEDIVSGLEAGAADYVAKPFNAPELLARVRTHLGFKLSRDRERSLVSELRKALAEVKRLSGLIPICAQCKKVRDDGGYWQQVEEYLSQVAEVQFSHGLCPDCLAAFKEECRRELEEDTAEPQLPPRPQPILPEDGTPARILVVDDSPSGLMNLIQFLRKDHKRLLPAGVRNFNGRWRLVS